MDRPASPLLSECSCVSLIGMAGSGKSTLGLLLARDMGWAHLDTDHLLEAHCGALLPELLQEKGLDGFLEAEGRIVADIKLCRTVISTGGSVVYSAPAVARLQMLGPMVYLRISLETFLRRLGDEGRRGFVRRPSMSLEEVYAQRRPLYESAADIILDTDADGPEACLARLREWLSP